MVGPPDPSAFSNWILGVEIGRQVGRVGNVSPAWQRRNSLGRAGDGHYGRPTCISVILSAAARHGVVSLALGAEPYRSLARRFFNSQLYRVRWGL
ncbi:Hypothetical protein NTJ_13158 [Nesidiocoris tenuis]|uniref:Uncharacterized protein n=1 Tax=Nesidiocoris tenuis TaxID=355587 RepID=A0ABN7B7J0_9HEMI|nr:Hypothetical protein NTJ_13158 [Nesidiocoris tenuis]